LALSSVKPFARNAAKSPRNVVRRADRKEIAGSTTIFSDLAGDRLRGTYERR
jgi:hypothetical protein